MMKKLAEAKDVDVTSALKVLTALTEAARNSADYQLGLSRLTITIDTGDGVYGNMEVRGRGF